MDRWIYGQAELAPVRQVDLHLQNCLCSSCRPVVGTDSGKKVAQLLFYLLKKKIKQKTKPNIKPFGIFKRENPVIRAKQARTLG